MARQVVGVFRSADLALEALGLLRRAGYGLRDLVLLSTRRVPFWRLRPPAQRPRMGPRVGVLAAVLWGALIGGAIFEAVGVAWALLATDSGALQLSVAV